MGGMEQNHLLYGLEEYLEDTTLPPDKAIVEIFAPLVVRVMRAMESEEEGDIDPASYPYIHQDEWIHFRTRVAAFVEEHNLSFPDSHIIHTVYGITDEWVEEHALR